MEPDQVSPAVVDTGSQIPSVGNDSGVHADGPDANYSPSADVERDLHSPTPALLAGFAATERGKQSSTGMDARGQDEAVGASCGSTVAHARKESEVAPTIKLRSGRRRKNRNVPVLDEEDETAYHAKRRALRLEREAILESTHSDLLKELAELKRERDNSLQQVRDEREYRLAEVRQRMRVEIQRANDEFENAKAELRRGILTQAYGLRQQVFASCGQTLLSLTAASRDKTASGGIQELEKAAIVTLGLTPDQVNEDLSSALRASAAANKVVGEAAPGSDDAEEGRSKTSEASHHQVTNRIGARDSVPETIIGSSN